MGVPPNPDELPPALEDLDFKFRTALEVHKLLPDTYIPGGMDTPIYKGKDLSPLDMLLNYYDVPLVDRKLIFRAVIVFDGLLVQDGFKKAKARADKAKRSKNKGG